MRPDVHARARSLLDRALVEGITPQEQRWLESHTEICAECGRYAEVGLRTVRALDGFAFELDPAAAVGVQEAVLRHASAPADRQFTAGLALAVALTVAGSVLVWQTVAWLTEGGSVAPRVWQMSVFLLWILPSVVMDLLLLFGRRLFVRRAREQGQAA
jgi:hypothetical protein